MTVRKRRRDEPSTPWLLMIVSAALVVGLAIGAKHWRAGRVDSRLEHLIDKRSWRYPYSDEAFRRLCVKIDRVGSEANMPREIIEAAKIILGAEPEHNEKVDDATIKKIMQEAQRTRRSR